MPARDANRGRGGGRGQSGGRQGSGGRDPGAQQSAAGQGRGGGGAGAGERAGQSQSGGGRSGASAPRGAEAAPQRAGGASAPGVSQRSASTTQGASPRAAGPAGARTASATTGSRTPGLQGGSGGAGTQSATKAATTSPGAASVGSDVNRRDMDLGDVGGGRGPSGGASELGAERQLDIDTAREGGVARGRSTGLAGGRGELGASGQVRSGRGPQGDAAVGGRGQGRQGLSPWFAGSENPFAMVRRMQEDLDRVFHAFGIPRLAGAIAPARELEELLARSPALTQAAQWSPQVEVFERDDTLVVRADLPGVRREDVEVNLENDVLTIRGQRRQEHRDAEGGYRRTERSYGTFFRQIPLPDGVDASQIEASYEDGVLEVTVPTPREQPGGRRRIEIR